VSERVRDMMAIIERLQTINRSLLNRLRPMALGHIPLRDLLADLVEERARQHADVALALTCGSLAPGYGEAIDLTVYRCVQEGLTNAIRHATPASVHVEIGETGDGRLRLAIRDDGRGIAPGTSRGFGLLGMEERVQALGGTFAIGPNTPQGAAIDILLPIADQPTVARPTP
jgi:two-component system sensor histidine kinase UhpB